LNPILEELLAIDEGMGLCWLGNLGWLLRADGQLVATDLDLERDERLAPSPISTADLAPHLDALFITHEHGDHFAGPTVATLIAESACRFVLPESCLSRGREFGISQQRVSVAIPDARPNGTPTLEPMIVCGIRVEPQRALHGHTESSVYRGASCQDCGYVLTLDGRRVYQPGDTVLLQQHLEDYADVEVLFVSPTLHNTHVDATTRMIEAMTPTHIFAQHFGTYRPTEANSFWTVGYPDEVGRQLSDPLRRGFQIPKQGVIYHL
jgi:L-ascorbate 6-phosphate lactonase